MRRNTVVKRIGFNGNRPRRIRVQPDIGLPLRDGRDDAGAARQMRR